MIRPWQPSRTPSTTETSRGKSTQGHILTSQVDYSADDDCDDHHHAISCPHHHHQNLPTFNIFFSLQGSEGQHVPEVKPYSPIIFVA